MTLDLTPFAGERVSLSLSIDSPTDARGAMAAFAAPVVQAGRRTDDARHPDVVLISLDTVRADRTSLYGNPRVTTPHLDRLGAEGLVFDNAVAVAPWTLPSHVSILSGQYPDRHGVYLETSSVPEGLTWLPREFREGRLRDPGVHR